MLGLIRRAISFLRDKEILHRLGVAVSVTVIAIACYILFHLLRNIDVDKVLDHHAILRRRYFDDRFVRFDFDQDLTGVECLAGRREPADEACGIDRFTDRGNDEVCDHRHGIRKTSAS